MSWEVIQCCSNISAVRVHCTNSRGCWMMLMWKLELQQTVHLPGEHPSPVVHNCLLYALPCCCREAKHVYSVPSEFLQDLILIPGLLLAQRICWLDPQAKAAFCVSVPLLSAKWQLVFPSVLGLKERALYCTPAQPANVWPGRFAVRAVLHH